MTKLARPVIMFMYNVMMPSDRGSSYLQCIYLPSLMNLAPMTGILPHRQRWMQFPGGMENILLVCGSIWMVPVDLTRRLAIGLEQQPLSFLLTQWLGNGLVDFKVAQSHSQLPPHLLKLEHSYRPFYGQTHFSTNVDVHTASLSHSMGMPLVRVTLLKAYGYHRRTNQLPMDAVI